MREVEKKIDNYPQELVSNREMIEGNFIFCLYKDPELFGDFDDILPQYDFMLEESKFYYVIGKEMFDRGYRSFDDATIQTHLSQNRIQLNGYVRRGGYEPIAGGKLIVHTDNVESYYDDLCKYNMLLGLHDKGFNISKNFDLFTKMTSDQVVDWYEYALSNEYLNRKSGVVVEDLELDDEFMQKADEGSFMGLSYASVAPLLNYHTLGIHREEVEIFAAPSGKGKTSFIMANRILPILDADSNEKVIIIANEQGIDPWKHLFLASILSSKIGYYKLPRKKVKMGGFMEQHREAIKKAQAYYEEHYKGRIKFAKLFDYSIDSCRRLIKKYAKRGFHYAVYDTFKAENASSTTMTGDLIEHSKQLLQTAEKEDVAIIITMQVAIYLEQTRYYTASILSNSKGVKEVVSELIMMRDIFDDEYSGQKNDIEPYSLEKKVYYDADEKTNKSKWVKVPITLDTEKKYKLVFLEKTRNDSGDVCLLYEFVGDFNKWVEIGYCRPKHDRQ